MSGKDTSSLRPKKRRRPTVLSRSTRDGDSEETRVFLSWLSRYYKDFSAGALPGIDEFLLEDNGEMTFLNSQVYLLFKTSEDSSNKLKVFYDSKTLTVKKLSCLMRTIDWNVFRALQKTIQHCSYLNVLQLDFCDLSSEQVKLLRASLKSGPPVTSLSLRGNPRCRDDLWLLFNIGLKFLNLKMCQIDQYALKKIRDVFRSSSPNTGLLHVDLSSNELFDEGCEYIASILKCDRGLTSLNVSDCKITDVGLTKILRSFRKFELEDEEIAIRRRLRFEYYKMLYQDANESRTNIEDIIRTHPFTNAVEAADGKLYCSGNDTLENLNLAYNALSDTGIDLVVKLLLESMDKLRLTRIGLEGNGDIIDATKSTADLLRLNKGRQSAGSIRSKGSLRRKSTIGKNPSTNTGMTLKE